MWRRNARVLHNNARNLRLVRLRTVLAERPDMTVAAVNHASYSTPRSASGRLTRKFPSLLLGAGALAIVSVACSDAPVKPTGGMTTNAAGSAGAAGAQSGGSIGTSGGGSAGAGGAGGTAGTGDAGSAGSAGAAGSAGGAGPDPGRCLSHELRIVAHQNDELLFMNPDLLESIRAGRCVRTVYLTAGDSGQGAAYIATRDLAIRGVYASMAGRADIWTESNATFAGKSLAMASLQDAEVSLVFMRLPDGGDGTGFPATGQQSLTKLLAGTSTPIRSVDGSNTFTRAELVATLAQLITDFSADLLVTQEFADTLGGDHPDHVAGGALALEAQTATMNMARGVVSYRGYDTVSLPPNLPPAVADANWELFLAHGRRDQNVCLGGVCPAPGARPTERVLGLYYDWCRQQFPYFKGSVVGFGGKCLAIPAGSSAPSPVELQTCSGAVSQRWTLTSDGQLSAQGSCLEVKGGGSASGTALQIAACEAVPHQRWSYGQIGIGEAGLTTTRFTGIGEKCMNVRSAPATDGAIEIADCNDGVEQGFWHYP